jgi:cytochrome c553
MKRTVIAATALGMVLFGPMGEGWSDDAPPPNADIDAGKAVAAACADCHGPDGISPTPEAPHLAGQHVTYLTSSLAAYKAGTREEPSMGDIAAKLSDADLVNVAAYYASLKPFGEAAAGLEAQANAATAAEDDPFAAVKEATAECADCHGADGNSDISGTPALAGQHATYLIVALQAYRDGSRADDIMQMFVEALGDAEIEDMAYYYAAMDPKRAEIPIEGDPYAGLAATASCVGCHGEDGNTKDPKTPRIAGLDAEYLETAMKAYKDGNRSHEIMRDAVATLRDADIRDAAAFYASKDPKAIPLHKPLTTAQWVEKCGRCHGPGGKSSDPRFPILAGQVESYLVKTLKMYHTGDRPNSMMQAMSFPMSESDIEKLAAFYAGQGSSQN